MKKKKVTSSHSPPQKPKINQKILPMITAKKWKEQKAKRNEATTNNEESELENSRQKYGIEMQLFVNHPKGVNLERRVFHSLKKCAK